jgi:hypothetical protein
MFDRSGRPCVQTNCDGGPGRLLPSMTPSGQTGFEACLDEWFRTLRRLRRSRSGCHRRAWEGRRAWISQRPRSRYPGRPPRDLGVPDCSVKIRCLAGAVSQPGQHSSGAAELVGGPSLRERDMEKASQRRAGHRWLTGNSISKTGPPLVRLALSPDPQACA